MARTLLKLCLAAATATLALGVPSSRRVKSAPKHDTSVLILGGGVAGIMAARMEGVDRFLIVEARDELGGGRLMRSTQFGVEDRRVTIELGAN
ncbi:hypothetical protein B0H17DRAFT_1032975 [Mycena rosella]|uniref:Amine oxidase domain-containing protein n=1 Tax=Mycena rosella TaxID=1033263 RepID=A0AAD7GXY9_MYCRO|nr:hypothetical protein B0H17DRAFT_1032975 [Mycena rosella]